VYTGFWWRNLRKIDHLEDPDVDGRIILGWVFRKWDEVAWIRLIWLRMGGKWRSLVNERVNLWVTKNPGNFLTSSQSGCFSRGTAS